MKRIVIHIPQSKIVLKQLIPEDAREYFNLLNKDRVHLSQHEDITAQKYPDEESVLKSITHPANPKKLRFGIWDGKMFVGMVGLTPLQKGVCETGGWTGKEFCRRGYGVITRTTLAQYAIEKLGYKKVIAKTHPQNIPSQGMLQKAGYRCTYHTNKFHYFVFSK